MDHSTDQDKSRCSLLCSAVPFSVYDFSLVLRGPWLQRDPRGYRPLGFHSCILPFHLFLIGACTKADVVFIRLVLLVDVLFQTFQRVGSTVKETVIPRVLAVHVTVVYTVMIDDFVMEGVNEEVVEIPVDVALADEPEGYMVMIDSFVMEVVDEEVAEIPVDVALADEPEVYMVMVDNFVMKAVDEEVAEYQRCI